MSKRKSPKRSLSRAASLFHRLDKARQMMTALPVPGARVLAAVRGITPKGEVSGRYENKMAELTTVLRDSGRFFMFQDQIVVEDGDAENARLCVLAGPSSVEPLANWFLPNFVICECCKRNADGEAEITQFPLPARLTGPLLHRQATRLGLPEILSYCKRPVFDTEFNLRGPGWHSDIGVLVHAIQIEPAALGEPPPASLPILDRIPLNLRQLLGDFCLKSNADFAAMLAAIISGVLAEQFIEAGKPIFLLDGNQPGLGKSWFAIVLGVLLDGAIPGFNAYHTDEAELAKQVIATARSADQSIIIFDNAKVCAGSVINSPTIESLCVAPHIFGRILHTSSNFRRRNNLLWVLTMNETKVSRDLRVRGVPIQFFFEGDPTKRTFLGRNPIEFAIANRAAILAEVFGMVERWKRLGRTLGTQRHRLATWAEVVGGIMIANGFPEFLENLDEATAEFDSTRDQLAAIAEFILEQQDGPYIETDAGFESADRQAEDVAISAGEFVGILHAVQIEADKLDAAKSNHAKATIAGQVLTTLVGREVCVEARNQTFTAVLRSIGGRSKKRYYLAARRVDPDLLDEKHVAPPTPTKSPRLKLRA